ncbi:MAG: hypothetical protein J7J36_00330 [Thermoplasmata archaeon]|nr:hypothetical protein [Thermoplasmata archaeon]
MKKLLIPFLIIILLSPLIHSNNLNWKIGDYWKYEITWYEETAENLTAKGVIAEYKVVGIENITFYGKKYHAYRVKETMRSRNFTSFYFYRVSDLAYIGGYPYWKVGPLIYDLPMEKFKFQDVGKKWNQSITEVNGGPNGEIFRNNTLVIHYECIGKKSIKTGAGNFECYVIKQQYESELDSYTIDYFSPEVKNIVLAESYENGKKIGNDMELISTSYHKEMIAYKYYIYVFAITVLLLIFITIIKASKPKNK